MTEQFDPYYTWLGISPEEQPADYYRLLGVRRFEMNPEAIANASDQRMTHLRTFQNGKRAAESQRLLNEIAAATRCLLDPQLRAQYDAHLKSQLAAQTPVAAQPAGPAPQPLPQAMLYPPQPTPQAMAYPGAIPNYPYPSPGVQGAPLGPFVAPLHMRPKPRNPGGAIVLLLGACAGLLVLGGLAAIWVLSRSTQPPEVVQFAPPVTPAVPAGLPKTPPPGPPPQTPPSIPVVRESVSSNSLVIGQPFNLLDLDWRPLQYGGRFEKQGSGWKSAGQLGNPDKVAFPFDSPLEYMLESTFVRLAGSDSINFHICVGGRPCAIVLNGFENEGFFSGLQLIDGRPLPGVEDPPPVKGRIIETGKEYKFRCEVTADRIVAHLDNRQIVNWQGPFSRLSGSPFTGPPNPRHWAVATWSSSYEIKRLELTPKVLAPALGPAPPASVNLPPGSTPSRSLVEASQRHFLSLRGIGHVQFSRQELLDSNQPFTLEMWFRCLADHPQATLMEGEGLQVQLRQVAVEGEMKCQLAAQMGELGMNKIVDPASAKWHHVALVGNSAEIGLHYDGVRQAHVPIAGKTAPVELILFGYSKNRGPPLQGEIAEIRLSTEARYTEKPFTPAPFASDSATRFFTFFSLKGMEVQFGPLGPVNHGIGGASYLGGDQGFPP